jgi:hypothetical protein
MSSSFLEIAYSSSLVLLSNYSYYSFFKAISLGVSFFDPPTKLGILESFGFLSCPFDSLTKAS